ncbi:TetR/AcrR family transcriptional regulator [Actinomadura viridis]|uniref:TetR/AcrR family transcriptional regulator n=1 Tax=Actinomadura viridis TaxID=58110 RepID=UPI0036BB51A4
MNAGSGDVRERAGDARERRRADGGRRQEDGRRRDEFVDRLIALFLERGFADLGIADMAAALRCSKSTLYTVAPSKEQIIVTVVRAFFRRATARVEARLDAGADPRDRLAAYLRAISDELGPASPAFFADLTDFVPTREVYRQNTLIAAGRVRRLVREASPAGDAAFVGAVAGLVMESIHSGEIRAATGLADSAAYAALADLISARMTRPEQAG